MRSRGHRFACRSLLAAALCLARPANCRAQAGPVLPGSAPAAEPHTFDPLAAPPPSASLLTEPGLTPGALALFDLERRFAASVAADGGKAFASWFADDAVSLANGKAPLLGRAAIAASANWNPKVYQLTWTPTAAQMGPSNDMGFTWGHYEGRSRDAQGEPIIVSGRYINVWKKMPDGTWKVALDASAQEPAAAGDCCALPKP